ncbi:MAG: TIGR04133 family radical SAM/SPASM protein [Bacteroidales bacterium]
MVSAFPFKKKLAFELFRLYRKNSKKIHQLDYIFWECTLRCNLSCLHCGSDCKKDDLRKDMPVNDFIRAIDEIREIVEPNKTQIVFTGGEPLLRKDLEECGIQLYHRGFPWGIVTNGFLLTQNRLESLLNSGLRVVSVSLDGLNASHNWLRNNPESFSKAMHSIQLLASVPDFRFDVVSCINSRNFEELGKLKELLIENKVKEWRIFTIFPTGRATDNPELQLSTLQFSQLFDFISETRKENRIKLNYGCEGFLGDYEGEVRDGFFFCRAGINIASILHDGSIAACPSIRESFVQGNIYRDNFSEIWQKRYKLFRNRDWMKTGECKDCSCFRYCDGNGLHLRDGKNGELKFCHYKRIQEGKAQGFC